MILIIGLLVMALWLETGNDGLGAISAMIILIGGVDFYWNYLIAGGWL